MMKTWGTTVATLAVASFSFAAAPTASIPSAPIAMGSNSGDVRVQSSDWNTSEVGPQVKAKSVNSGRIVDKSGHLVGMWKRLAENSSGSEKISDGPQISTAGVSFASYNTSTGGGDWRYGTYVDGSSYKHCWSFYYHAQVKHKATADMSSAYWGTKISQTVVATPGADAKAEPGPSPSGATGTCYAYWSNSVK